MYKCPIYWVTGLPCPGCGMTRALFCLLHGDINGAFFMHPLIFIMPVLLMLFIFGSRKVKKHTATVMIIVFFAVYTLRMIMYFPDSEPMLYNDGSILARILDMINR